MTVRWCLPAPQASSSLSSPRDTLGKIDHASLESPLTHLAYSDSSNLFIEAQKVSAVARGMAQSLHRARQRGIIDFDCRLDLYRLMDLLARAETPVRAVLFGSTTEGNEGVWRHAAQAGFEVVTEGRSASRAEPRPRPTRRHTC
jgi:hypothetical protein